jgi:hypothetical protein
LPHTLHASWRYGEQLAHLERLAAALHSQSYTAEIVGAVSRPYLMVANADTPTLNERVFCGQATDGSWVFLWPWKQPIGPVGDLKTVAGKIAEVLRAVAGEP